MDEEESAAHQAQQGPSTSNASSNGSSSNGSGNGSSSHHPASGQSSVSEGDAVRGLVYGATVRFSDSAALRLRRRAMVVWEEVRAAG